MGIHDTVMRAVMANMIPAAKRQPTKNYLSDRWYLYEWGNGTIDNDGIVNQIGNSLVEAPMQRNGHW
jgi:hypothetical protein